MKLRSFWARSRRSVQIDTRSFFCSAVRRRGTNFAVTHLIRKSSVRIFWHVPNAILTSSAASLIVRRWSARMISRTCATVSSVWEVKACLGGVHLQRIGIHFWNGNTTQMSSIDLGRTLRKLLAAFCTFQHQFSPDRNRNQCTHAAALSPPSWNATHTVVDVHPRASTERMLGDTDLRFCTYTCTELPLVPLCCHFATYYSFPEKKSVPELNDQPTYIWLHLVVHTITRI